MLIIVAFICYIAVGKKRKRQNVRSSNTQRIELQTIRSPETSQRTNQTSSSRPLPNTTLNTITQRENQYNDYVTPSANQPVADRRPLPPYNESSNAIGSSFATLPAPILQAPYRVNIVRTLPPPSYDELFNN